MSNKFLCNLMIPCAVAAGLLQSAMGETLKPQVNDNDIQKMAISELYAGRKNYEGRTVNVIGFLALPSTKSLGKAFLYSDKQFSRKKVELVLPPSLRVSGLNEQYVIACGRVMLKRKSTRTIGTRIHVTNIVAGNHYGYGDYQNFDKSNFPGGQTGDFPSPSDLPGPNHRRMIAR